MFFGTVSGLRASVMPREKGFRMSGDRSDHAAVAKSSFQLRR
jgi:hypothetical protein